MYLCMCECIGTVQASGGASPGGGGGPWLRAVILVYYLRSEKYQIIFLRTSPPSSNTLGLATPGTPRGGHSGDTPELGWGCGNPGMLCAGAFQGHSGVERSRDTEGWAFHGSSGLGTPATIWGWALQGFCGVRHFQDHLGTLGTPKIIWGWALQKSSGVGHSSDHVGLGTPRTIWGWALQRSSRVGHSGDICVWGTQGSSGVGHSCVSEFGIRGSQRGVPEDQTETGRGVVAKFKVSQPHTEGGEIQIWQVPIIRGERYWLGSMMRPLIVGNSHFTTRMAESLHPLC